MSTLFGVRGSRSPKLTRVADTTADDQGRSGRYLTDGRILYRYITTVASGMRKMVELEDCHSLELTWLPIGQLRYLRAVIAAPGRVANRAARTAAGQTAQERRPGAWAPQPGEVRLSRVKHRMPARWRASCRLEGRQAWRLRDAWSGSYTRVHGLATVSAGPVFVVRARRLRSSVTSRGGLLMPRSRMLSARDQAGPAASSAECRRVHVVGVSGRCS